MKWLEVLKSHPKKDKKSTSIIDIKKTVQYSSIIRRLANKGLTLSEASEVEMRLKKRNKDGDDRSLCYECLNLLGSKPNWQCAEAVKAGISINKHDDFLGDLVDIFQRCDAFKSITLTENY